MGKGTSLGYLPPLGHFSASLGRVGWELLGDRTYDMASHKFHKYCRVIGRVAKVQRGLWIRKLYAWAASK